MGEKGKRSTLPGEEGKGIVVNQREMNTKHRIFQDNDIMLTDNDLKYEEKRNRNRRSKSRSYDFLGDNVDYEEERRKKIEARKRNLIKQYKLGKDHWTKDTSIVLQTLEKSVKKEDPQQRKPNKNKNKTTQKLKKKKEKDNFQNERKYSPEVKDPEWVMADAYEDPRLTQMKYEMKMHEKLRSQIRNKSPLKGDSTYEHDKKVRELKRLMNTSNRSISANKSDLMLKKIGHKKKGDFVKVEFDQNKFLDEQDIGEEEPNENRERKYRKVSPLKMEYDYKGSFRIGFEEKEINEDDK
jgi:hypothetical protein